MTDSENLDEGITHRESGGNIQQKVPGSTTALVCGIISIPFAGLVGVILGIIAISSGGGAIKKFEENPGNYTEGSLKNAKAGQICGIIGLVASALWLIYIFGRL
ncbi:MAG: hypothetical protein NXI10_10060 [bacterium]|nr:hypothetical protein [bacterium]